MTPLVEKKVWETKGGKLAIIGLVFTAFYFSSGGVAAVLFPAAAAAIVGLAQTAIGATGAIIATVITGHSAVEFRQSGMAQFVDEQQTIEERDLGRAKEDDYTHEDPI